MAVTTASARDGPLLLRQDQLDAMLAAAQALEIEGDARVARVLLVQGREEVDGVGRKPLELGKGRAVAREELGAAAIIVQRLPDGDADGLALHHHRAQRAKDDAVAQRARRIADADARAELLVDAFEPRGGVHRIAARAIGKALARAEIADHRGPGMDADPCLAERDPLLFLFTAEGLGEAVDLEGAMNGAL